MPEPVSRAARKHMRRDKDRGGAPQPAPAAPSSPAPAPPPQPPPPPPWAAFGKACKALTDQIYIELRVEPPPLDVWEAFAASWGLVLQYYVPTWQTTPVPQAVLLTAIVAAPLVQGILRRRAELAEKAAQKAPELTVVEGGRE